MQKNHAFLILFDNHNARCLRHALTTYILNLQSFDKFFRMGIGIFVSVWVTRFLGPEQFGALSYAIAFSGIFSSLASLGLDGIIIRELSQKNESRDNLLGTAFLLKLCGAVLAYSSIIILIFLIKSTDYNTIFLVAIIAFGLFFNSFDVIDLWFQSQLKYKFTFYARNTAFTISSILKIIMILLNAPLFYFAIITTIEVFFGAAGLIFVYKLTKNNLKNWTASLLLAKQLMAVSWPLIIAGFAKFIYVKIDQVMLGTMLNNKEVGIYSAAIKFSEIWYFIPGAIYASVFPVLAEYKTKNERLFFLKYKKVCSIMVLISVIIALIMTFLSNYLINLLYGKEFIQAGPILSVHIWAGVFVFIGVAGSIWTMIEGLQKFQLFATGLGGITNILLNIILIPRYAGMGSAFATVISYAIASYLVYFFAPKNRKVALILTNSLFSPWRSFR